MFDPAIFRRYDIRGRAPEVLSPLVAEAVAKALGTRIRHSGQTGAVVGRDVRHSSPDLAAAVRRGFTSTGLKVHDLGIVPTPVMYHALHHLRSGGGIMVTGSHNPRGDNGLKCCLGTDCMFGNAITTLRDDAMNGPFAVGAGTVVDTPWLDTYFHDVLPRFSFRRRFRVVVDCGNGVMGPVVLAAMERLGISVDPLFCEPDGDFPNHIPDPEEPACMETLRARVVATGADLGLGFDGDGDRVGVIDDRGTKVSADLLLAVFAGDMLTRFPGGRVRFDVKCSDVLDAHVRARGGIPIMGETGHSLLKRDITNDDAIVGGELSGHIVFNRGYLPIDDSLFAALMLLKILDAAGGACHQLFSGFPPRFSTAEIKVPCADSEKVAVVDALVAEFQRSHDVITIDGARVVLPDGWFLVRASNTTPNLTVRFESATRTGLLVARDLLATALQAHPAADAAVLAAV